MSPDRPETPVHISNRVLSLILLPTERCNFRCTYCYEDFARGKMKPEVVRGVKNFLTRRVPELDHLSLGWFGGEPLLAADLIEEIQSHAQSLVRRFPRIEFHTSMTTNGYLLDRDRFERLVEMGVGQYQISVDGPREVHDLRRKLAGGGGTFARIMHNLRAMREIEQPFEVIVRVHIDEQTRETVPQLLDELERSFGGDERFELLLRPTSRLGGANDETVCALQGGTGPQTVDESRELARSKGLRQFDRPEVPVCYASSANSFLVRTDGVLGKCTVALDDPANQVGTLSEDGGVAIDAHKMRPWMRGLFTGEADELACPLGGLSEAVEQLSANRN